MPFLPTTEDEIRTAVEDPDFDESHHLDAKALIGDTPHARKETAKDLAAFAIDGGVLIIGVAEDKQLGTFSLAPIRVGDEAVRRLEQIPENAITPPVEIRVSIVRATEPEKGYLIVDIPPSPSAPHMVGNRYYGRAERSNRALSDSEVARLITRRHASDSATLAALAEMQANDPYVKVRTDQSTMGHTYILARPVSAPRDVADRLVWDKFDNFERLIFSSGPSLPEQLRQAMPTPTLANAQQNRARGRARTSLGQGRTERPDLGADQAVDIELRTDGTIAALIGGTSRPGTGGQLILDRAITSWLWHMAVWARDVSHLIDYRGQWEIGIRSTKLRGGRSRQAADDPWETSADRYDASEYERVTRTFVSDLDQEIAPVVERLARPLLLTLDSWNQFSNSFQR